MEIHKKLTTASGRPYAENENSQTVGPRGPVSKNVVRLSDEMFEKHGIFRYYKQPKLKKFIVLGNETGLFILVEENRNWYPTNKKAKSFWTKVLFLNNRKTEEIEILT